MTPDPAVRPVNVDVTVNGRYRLTRWVSRTVLADEYLADDLLLDRVVLFKALRPELVSDKSFVDRFRAQAQAGANLSHPAINAILDWGRDPGPIPDGRGAMRPGPTYYLVAEQAEGRTLTELVAANGPMPIDRAAHVIVAATAALGFAHRAGSVHGGLTPDLIRVSPSGVVKVMDLGLTRALGASWVPAEGSVEQAAWLSPEQFRGDGASEKTDVYQVGLIAYYLVTGRAPYAGETVEVLRDRHLNQVPLAPTKLNAGLPKPFEAFIGRSMAKDPDDRYGSVTEQRGAMVRVRERIAAANSGPVVKLTPPTTDAARPPAHQPAEAAPLRLSGRAEDDATVVMSSGMAVQGLGATDTSGRTSVADATSSKNGDATLVQPRSAKPRAKKGPISDDAALPAGPDQDFSGLERRARRWPYFTALVILLAILGFLTFLLNRQLRGGDTATGSVVVPSLESRPLAEAQNVLKEAGLRVDVQRENSATLEADTVIRQTPTPGAKVAEGSLVTLTVSTGSTKPTVPNVVGLTASQAKSVLASYGLVMTVAEKKDDTVDAGTIVGQEPRPETEVEKGATVTVQVAVSSGTKEIPKVDKKTTDEARAALLKEGFLIVVQSEASNEVEKGLVIRTEPAGGTSVAKGSPVVIVASGGNVIAVPNVIGKDQASATAALEGANLTVTAKDRTTTDPTQSGKVISQSPAPSSEVELRANVTIRIGILDTPVTTTTTPAGAGDPPVTEAPVLQTVPTAAPTTAPPTAPPTTAAAATAPPAAPVPAAGAASTTVPAVVVVAPSSAA
jgi:eukaryotic-like serine/threonine-protein kinase